MRDGESVSGMNWTIYGRHVGSVGQLVDRQSPRVGRRNKDIHSLVNVKRLSSLQ